MEPPRPLHIILDFDGTITTKDTIEPLVQSAISLHYPSFSPSQLGRTPYAVAWAECKSLYVADLSAHSQKEDHSVNDETVVTAPNCLRSEQRNLAGLRDVERTSVERVGKSGIFKGISEGLLRERGRQATNHGKNGTNNGVALRKGFRDFVRWIEKKEVAKWGVVSVNWSREWVGGVLDAALSGDEQKHIAVLNSVRVMANEIQASTGLIEGCKLDAMAPMRTRLLTTADKLLAQEKMLSYFQTMPLSSFPLAIYIGDSPTDLSPLLQADVGIIMRSPSSTAEPLIELINKCGYGVLPVSDYQRLYSKGEDGKEFILLSAFDFEEIVGSGSLDDQEWILRMAKTLKGGESNG